MLGGGRATHPRPDRFRPSWWPLDGAWEFAFDDADIGLTERWFEEGPFDREIRVPFPHQAPASGLEEAGVHPVVWYRLGVDFPDAGAGRLLLHFGAVDETCTVWIDGTTAGGNEGGYVPFALDVTPWASRHANVVVRVVDRTSADRPRGKQRAGGGKSPYDAIRYTASTGLWQPVWLERVGATYLEDFHVRTSADGSFHFDATVGGDERPLALVAELSREGRELLRLDSEDGARIAGRLEGVVPWSPDQPVLYDLQLSLVDGENVADRVETRIGFRTLRVEGDELWLNGEPLVLRLVLDQGYWPEGLTTPPDDDAIRADVAWLRAAGFNGVRKHQKLEDPRFWRWADELGLLVWQDMPAPGFGDALSEEDHERLMAEWERGVRRDRSHPAAICFAPFNESWGIAGVRHDEAIQALVRKAAERTRALAPDALVVDNSGWHHVDSDLLDLHSYEADPERLAGTLEKARDAGFAIVWHFEFEAKGDFLKFAGPDGWVRHDSTPLCDGVAYRGQPVVLSEFGGIGCVLEGDTSHPDRFVYGESGTPEALAEALEGLVGVVEGLGLAGWCWTQLSDIEQEENGLLTYDRRPKLPADRIAGILKRAAARRPATAA